LFNWRLSLPGRLLFFLCGEAGIGFHPNAVPYGKPPERGWQHRDSIKHALLEPLYGTPEHSPGSSQSAGSCPNLPSYLLGRSLRGWAEDSVRRGREHLCFLGRIPENEMPGLFADLQPLLSGSRTDGTLYFAANRRSLVGVGGCKQTCPANREWVHRERTDGWCHLVTTAALTAVLHEVAGMDLQLLQEIGANNLVWRVPPPTGTRILNILCRV